MSADEAVSKNLIEMGKRIESLRIAAGYDSARSLSRAMGDSPSYQSIINWENGVVSPNKKTLVKLAEALHSTPEYIIYGIGDESVTISKGKEVPILEFGNLLDFFSGDFTAENFDWVSERFSDNAFLLKVDDDSMASSNPLKSIPVGSKVLVDPNIEPANDKIVLVQTKSQKFVIRRLIEDVEHSFFTCENPVYKAFDRNESTIIRGRVVQVIMDLV